MAYATAAMLRDWLGIPQGDQASKEKVERALAAAIELVDDYCGRSFGSIATSSAKIFDGNTDEVLIDDAATVTIVEQSTDRQTWSTVATTDWWTEPATLTPKTTVRALYRLNRFVRVTGTWGHASTVPKRVEQATLMMAGRLYARHKSTTGVEGFGDFGVVRISRQTDPDIAALLDPLCRVDRTMGIA